MWFRNFPDYLRSDLLETGDIILTSQKQLGSTAIRYCTFSKYSHASLVLSAVLRFESTPKGIGFNIVPIDRVENHFSRGQFWLQNISNYKKYDVFRHPDMNRLVNAGEQIYTIIENYFAKEYPYSHLPNLSIIPIPPQVKKHLIDKLRKKNTGNSKEVDPGEVCSMLIFRIYQELGLQLFKRHSVKWVSPGKLSRSNLIKQTMLRCSADLSKSNDIEEKNRLNKDYDFTMESGLNIFDIQFDTDAHRLNKEYLGIANSIELNDLDIDALNNKLEKLNNIFTLFLKKYGKYIK